jgi:hypothetical protein
VSSETPNGLQPEDLSSSLEESLSLVAGLLEDGNCSIQIYPEFLRQASNEIAKLKSKIIDCEIYIDALRLKLSKYEHPSNPNPEQ